MEYDKKACSGRKFYLRDYKVREEKTENRMFSVE